MPTSSESSLPEDKNDIIYSEEGERVIPPDGAEETGAEPPLLENNTILIEEPVAAAAGIETPEVPELPAPLTEDQLPPEAQGEANGGPLGCCLGTTIGLLLSVSIALLSRFYSDPLTHVLGGALSIVTRILMGLVAIVAVLICSYFGWRIGKNVYREYNVPIIPEHSKRKSR